MGGMNRAVPAHELTPPASELRFAHELPAGM